LKLTSVVVLLAIALAAPAMAQSRYPEDARNPDGGAFSSRSWPGGPHSLPLGSHPPSAVIQAALAMEPMKVAVREFESRGYLRRADQDACFTNETMSVVAICWQKPGIPTESRQPTIFAATKFINGYYVTQIYGGVVGSDDGVTLETFGESFVLSGSRHGSGSPRGSRSPNAGGTSPGELAGFCSAYDPAGWNPITGPDFWSYAVWQGTGYPVDVWQQYGQAMGQPIIVGGLSGWARYRSWQGAAWGAVCGWCLANNGFWLSHPK
jgi:hypothetical protein